MLTFSLVLLQTVITAAVPTATAYLCNYLKTKKDEVKEKTKTDIGKRLLDRACDAIVTAVSETNQTYVETMKKEGKFSKENQKEAFDMAFKTALKIMTQETKDFIVETFGDLNTWVTSKIEAEVNAQKVGLLVEDSITE